MLGGLNYGLWPLLAQYGLVWPLRCRVPTKGSFAWPVLLHSPIDMEPEKVLQNIC